MTSVTFVTGETLMKCITLRHNVTSERQKKLKNLENANK
jgi:hypothetical protein